MGEESGSEGTGPGGLGDHILWLLLPGLKADRNNRGSFEAELGLVSVHVRRLAEDGCLF